MAKTPTSAEFRQAFLLNSGKHFLGQRSHPCFWSEFSRFGLANAIGARGEFEIDEDLVVQCLLAAAFDSGADDAIAQGLPPIFWCFQGFSFRFFASLHLPRHQHHKEKQEDGKCCHRPGGNCQRVEKVDEVV